MYRRLLFFAILFTCCLTGRPQTPAYPKNYFRNPLGIPMQLSANFGELRPNHWHMGLDIRTNQQENLPVYAAAAGYISHIGIRPQSFGRFIVITHPNGLSTLYGHLNDFYPGLEQYVTEQQYKKESWAIELDLTKEQFPVSQGQFIAYSGNTGGSQGPHLHFEIFDTKTTKRLNPLLFGFQLEDNVAPDLTRLALYDRSKSVYAQAPVFYPLKNTDSGYIIPKYPVLKLGLNKISFAIQATDRLSGSSNPNGIFSAKLFLDDEPQVSFVLDSIDYHETAYINSQIDYRHRSGGGSFVQHLSQLPGDHGAAYRKIKGDGVIQLNDTNVHLISIDVKDAYGNTSQLNFGVQYFDSLAKFTERPVTEKFAPNKVNTLTKTDFVLTMGEGCLYDTIQPLYYRSNSSAGYAVTAAHQLNDATIPIHDDMLVKIKADRPVQEGWQDKLVMLRSSKGNTIRKVEKQGDWLVARFGDLGTFQVFADVTPPVINDLGKKDTLDLSPASRIVFTPTDNMGVVKQFRVELNGQWLRFTNDKSRNWIYKFDERCPYGVHELKATATDLVGNTTTQTWWFKRYPYTPPPPKKKAVKKKTSTKKTAVTTKKKTAPVKKKKSK